MCSSISALVTCLEELRRPPVGVAELGDFLVAMARLLELAQSSYVEGVAHFDAVKGARAEGGRASTKDWLTGTAGRSPRQASGDARLARLLHGDPKRPLIATNEALHAGRLSFEQAKTIAAALSALDPETVQGIEATLVEAVAEAEQSAASTLCAHAVELATPQSAVSRARVQARKRHFDFFPSGDMIGVSGLLSADDAEVVAAAIAPFAQPQTNRDSPEAQDNREPAQRRVDALVELARRALAGGDLPISGGLRPQVHLTIDVNDLQADSPATCDSNAGFDSGSQPDLGARGAGCVRRDRRRAGGSVGRSASGRPVPAWEARMTCCDAEVTPYLVRGRRSGPGSGSVSDLDPNAGFNPATDFDPNAEPDPVDPFLLNRLMAQLAPALGGTPLEVLELGRSVRLIPASLRKALWLRDRGCAYPGCDRPPAWCDAHHNLRHWIDGGESNLDNCVLACRHHHVDLHQRNQMLVQGPDGRWQVASYTGSVLAPAPADPGPTPAGPSGWLDWERELVGAGARHA